MRIDRMDGTGAPVDAETAHEAAKVINAHKENGGWAFVDGKMVNQEEVTEEQLEGADRVVLSPSIRGG